MSRRQTRPRCDRCTLPRPPAGACEWCAHDPADPDQVAALHQVQGRLRGLSRDRRARREHFAATGAAPMGTCPACGQFGGTVICDWCSFPRGDEVAVAALTAWEAARADARRARRAALRVKLAPPSRRPTVGDAGPAGAPAPAARPRPFGTCPACRQWTSFGIGVCDWCAEPFDVEVLAHRDEEYRFSRRRWAARRQHLYSVLRGLVRFDVGEQGRLVGHLVRWAVLGAVVGILAGLASAGFLATLRLVTSFRQAHPWMLLGLPLAGFAVGLAYHRGGGRAGEGNNLILEEIHEPRAWVPKRMAVLTYAGTVLTHLFGGSAGREGTAIQMSGSLTDGLNRLGRFSATDRRMLLIAAIAGGFGSVFGVPVAGFVFALEVQAVGRMRYDAIVPALSASVVGDLVVRATGVHHVAVPRLGEVTITPLLLGKMAVAGLAFGLASILFAELTHGIRRAFASVVHWPPARPLVGGVLIIGLTLAVGSQAYLGLSTDLIAKSLAGGAGVAGAAFALKLLFTSVTLGAGFQGGEVTPLFVIGATLGATLGRLLGVPVPLLAACGFVAVFAGATNTPLACTVMAAELFGSGPLLVFAVTCVTAYVFSAHRGIYSAQRVATPKGGATIGDDDGGELLTLAALARRRRHWLPPAASTGGGAPAGPAEDGEAAV